MKLKLRKVAAFGLAGALLVGGSAFAEELTEEPVLEEETVVEEPVVEEEPFQTETDTDIVETAPVLEEEIDTDTVESDPADEGDGPPEDTHGAYVSEIARTTPPGPDHGKIVSEAARSKAPALPADETEEEPVVDEEPVVEEAPTAETSSSSSHPGKGKGLNK